VAATLISFAWIGLEALGRVPPLDAVGVFLILMFVQILAVSVVTTRAMSQTALFGKPA
jgi:hypothetical protein